MYDPFDLTNPAWRRYRLMRRLWWLLFLVGTPLLFVLPFEYAVFLGLGIGVSCILVAFEKCPICSQPVGRGDMGRFLQPIIWPFGGWCLSCGKRISSSHPWGS